MQILGILRDTSQNAARSSKMLACATGAGSQSCVVVQPMLGPSEMSSEAKGGCERRRGQEGKSCLPADSGWQHTHWLGGWFALWFGSVL